MQNDNRKFKVCFLHIPADNPDSKIRLLPIGLIALNNMLKKSGLSSSILHLGVEKSIDPNFNLINFLKKKGHSVVLLDLHWHHQTPYVLKTTELIKKKINGIKIVLGGFTASFFYKEIMRKFKAVDFLIRGDAEIPVATLCELLKKRSKGFNHIQNLSWREKEKIIHNSHEFTINKKILNRLDFSDYSSIRNYKKYISDFTAGPGKYDSEPTFYFSPGRGCNFDCSFCGGSRSSQKIINNRKQAILMNERAALITLKNAKKFGFKKVNICFDPIPASKYYCNIFKMIREHKLDITMSFESFHLPSLKLIDEFSKTFNYLSSMTISPESGCDEVRLKNNRPFFKNSQLMETLEYLKKKNIKTYLSFTAGLPYDTKKGIFKTIMMINFIRNKFPDIEINCDIIPKEPTANILFHNKTSSNSILRTELFDHYLKKSLDTRSNNEAECLNYKQVLEILKLYRAETKCIYKFSNFLKGLLNDYRFKNSIDIFKIKKLCRPCPNYEKCFKN